MAFYKFRVQVDSWDPEQAFPQVLCANDGLPFVLAFRQMYTTEPGLGGARPPQ